MPEMTLAEMEEATEWHDFEGCLVSRLQIKDCAIVRIQWNHPMAIVAALAMTEILDMGLPGFPAYDEGAPCRTLVYPRDRWENPPIEDFAAKWDEIFKDKSK